MLLEKGEKIHVLFKRLFEGDVRRHFAGEVEFVEGYMVRAVGYTFIYDLNTGKFHRKPELRTRIISLQDSHAMLTVLPSNIKIEALGYSNNPNQTQLQLRDDMGFSLDMEEFSSSFTRLR